MFFFISFDILDMTNDTKNRREKAKSLRKPKGRWNTPCVKFGNPAPRFEGLTNKSLQMHKKRYKFPIKDFNAQN